jgi:hypothetical protein
VKNAAAADILAVTQLKYATLKKGEFITNIAKVAEIFGLNNLEKKVISKPLELKYVITQLLISDFIKISIS